MRWLRGPQGTGNKEQWLLLGSGDAPQSDSHTFRRPLKPTSLP